MGIRKLMAFAGITLVTLNTSSIASGACCVLTKSDSRSLNFSITGAHSWGDLMTDDEMYRLSQEAVILKLSAPVVKGLSLQAQVGLPVRTVLGKNDKPGFGGFMFGGGAGYAFPEIANRLSFSIALSASRSYSRTDSQIDNTIVNSGKSTLVITEGAGFLVADFKILEQLNIYGGVNISMDATELQYKSIKKELGEPMIMISPLAGMRWNMNNHSSVLFEAGFGHNNVLSLSFVLPILFSKQKSS